jgi:predicted Fe-Mo cluster-binding NifX family protein
MKIAVATENEQAISQHFGRSPRFAIYEIEDGNIVGTTMRENTFTRHFREGHHHDNDEHNGHHHAHGQHRPGEGDHHGHRSIAEGLGDCDVVISRGMGRRAWEDLRAAGIEMIVTDESDVEKAVLMYLQGNLKDQTDKLH